MLISGVLRLFYSWSPISNSFFNINHPDSDMAEVGKLSAKKVGVSSDNPEVQPCVKSPPWNPRNWLPSLNSCSCNPKSPESELTPTPAIHSHQPSTSLSHYQPFSFHIRSPAKPHSDHQSFLTYQLTMALHVETSWCPYQLFHRTLSINLTASIVSCQSCVVYTTFVGNSVLSFTTSKLNY